MSKLFPVAFTSVALMASGFAYAQAPAPQPGQPGKTPPASTAPAERIAPSAKPGTATAPQWYTGQTGDVRVSKLMGSTVRNSAGESIGEINEVVLDKDGKVAAVVIGVGGFLGIGEREVAMQFDSLQLARDNDQSLNITVQATKDSLRSAPEWRGTRDGGMTGTKPAR